MTKLYKTIGQETEKMIWKSTIIEPNYYSWEKGLHIEQKIQKLGQPWHHEKWLSYKTIF